MNRIEVIQRIINRINARVYLEVGVSNGACFTRISAPFRIGVDPKPATIQVSKILDQRVRYYRLTSDLFFQEANRYLENQLVDVAFIDGCHSFEQSSRDLENCLKVLSEKGVIVMHDCNPGSARMTSPGLSGEVWKTIVSFRSTRQDLHIMVLDCDCGLGIIKKGVPENSVNLSLSAVQSLQYADLDRARESLLNLKETTYFE